MQTSQLTQSFCLVMTVMLPEYTISMFSCLLKYTEYCLQKKAHASIGMA